MTDLPTIEPDKLASLRLRGRELWNQFLVFAGKRNHLFVPCDHDEAYPTLQQLAPRATTFLEFGSAAGVMTIMADLLGMEACGIEIEPWLVDRSTRLAAEFESEATFAEGTFVPLEYQREVRNLSGDRLTPTEGTCGFAELGVDLTDFDVVFAYPWPGDEEWLHELMRRHARPDTILLTYDAREGYESRIVSEL